MATNKSKAAGLLAIIALAQLSVFLLLFAGNLTAVPAYLGFASLNAIPVSAWGSAAAATIVHVAWAATLSPVRHYLFRLDFLKLLAVFAALLARIVEEVVFRKLLMDWLNGAGYGLAAQAAASGLAFGLVHLIWGAKRLTAGINAFLSTTMLGVGLAGVYILSGRNLAPCVIAHFAVSALIEPGLLLAAAKDRLGAWRERAPAD
ncbi:MAG: CPBP family intramembrane metalloprotease [Alphaproteobacteria bacterium]|nr:CPBP family intramembrane metalloprotease [Alphaproteobacteria bacterium]